MKKIIHHTVHANKNRTEDVDVRLQSEPSICRNWCARVSLISVLALLFGFVGLIIENLNTPLQESRFSEYFDGLGNQHHDDENIVAHEIENDDLHYKEEYDGNFKVVNQPDDILLLQKIADRAKENNNIADSEGTASATEIIPWSADLQSFHRKMDFIESELKRAKEAIIQNNFQGSLKIYESLILKHPDCPATLYGQLNALSIISSLTDKIEVLQVSVLICLQHLDEDGYFSDEDFKRISYLCIHQMRIIRTYDPAIRIHFLLIKRFDNDPRSRHELAQTYMDMDNSSNAKDILEENLKRWPNNGISLIMYGLLLYKSNDINDAIHYLRLGVETGEEGTQDWLTYSLLGDALLHTNRTDEARKLFRKCVTLKIIPSEYQRPIKIIKDLKAQPIWTKEETTYSDIYNLLESNWRQIRDEALSVLSENGYFKDGRQSSIGEKSERDFLTNFGVWQEFYLFNNGVKQLENCKSTPLTCTLIEIVSAGLLCKNCQVLFSAIHPGSHVIPHCGSSNTRLRSHLGLQIPKGAKLRIAADEVSWIEGKFLIFDDSFEHEIWNNGSSIRLILLFDLWHPDITDEQKQLFDGKNYLFSPQQ